MERRTAVITGAGSGIGAACVKMLLEREYRVVAVGRSEEQLQRLSFSVDDTRLMRIPADVRDKGALEGALSRIPWIDLLVANAGVCKRTPVDGSNADAAWDEIIDINLSGVWRTFRAAIGKFRDNGSAVVVSSGLGKLGRAGYSAYAAAKHGVLGLVKCLSRELAPRGIRVNAVCPGWVDTKMAELDIQRSVEETGISFNVLKAAAIIDIPLGRFVTAEETAELICFLLSREARAITGQSYNISCGEFSL